jgi:cytochrome c-type biogenesis protein CcmE
MKKIHIVGIIVIAVAIGVIVYSLGSNASYANFAEAISNPDTEYHVVGKLNKDFPVQYDPKIKTDECSFIMQDNNGLEKTVILHKNVSQDDLKKTEQIVVIGKMEGPNFHANDILMKCPSKYNAGTPQVQ